MNFSNNILHQRAFASSPSFTPLQSQVDGLVGSFTQQATDWRSLAAMMAGGMAYRFGRMGVMATGVRGGRVLSLGLGLGTEVSTFEMTHRSLTGLTSEGFQNPNLWHWSGQGGIRQGLLSSLITFGSLKGAGHLGQGENLMVQHLLQDTGMVLGHKVSASFGITERPQGTLAEQFLHAEATNLQLGAGMALAHSVAPGIQGLERGLDLSLRTDGGMRSSRPAEEASFLQMQPAIAGSGSHPAALQEQKSFIPSILAMSGQRENSAISSWPPPAEEIPEVSVPGRKISGVIERPGSPTYSYVALEKYQAQTLSLIRRILSTEEIGRILEREGKGTLFHDEVPFDPRIRGLLLAEAANQGLQSGRFPRTMRQWNMIQRWIENAYVHFDLETLRSYRENLSPEWWTAYRSFLDHTAQKLHKRRGAEIPLYRLDRPLPGEYIIPRTDGLRDAFLRQFFPGEKRSPGENWNLLRDPQKLGHHFVAAFGNTFGSLVASKTYLRRLAPDNDLGDLPDSRRTDLEMLAHVRKIVLDIPPEIKECARILRGNTGEFHRAFLQSFFTNQYYIGGTEYRYEETRQIIEQVPRELRHELEIENLPSLIELGISLPEKNGDF
jgi:hypothetical protein